MIFYSLTFLLFFVMMSVLLHLSKTIKWQHRWVLLANVLFYAYWDVRFLLLLMGIAGVCYLSAIGYEKAQSDAILLLLWRYAC